MSEAAEQKEIVGWFRENYPQYSKSIRVSMAGLPRHGRKGAIQWGMMKGQGVVDGESDIAILLPRNGFGALLIEHKSAEGSYKATPEQLDYIEYHNSVGNCACVTKGVDMAKAAIAQYMGQT